MQRLTIPGSSGKLEAILDLPEDASQCAILCHPHPLYGGSMSDYVVTTMASAVLATGVGVLRFNFRGVGSSEGDHDKGRGEVDDLVSVADYLRREIEVSSIIVGGYSFGAVVALNAIEATKAVKAILVAPPVKMMDVVTAPALVYGIPIQVILGEADDIVDVIPTSEFFKNASVSVIPGANHFFAESDSEINNIIMEFMGGA